MLKGVSLFTESPLMKHNTNCAKSKKLLLARATYHTLLLMTDAPSDIASFEVGNVAMCTQGHNLGRVGVIVHRDRHHGGFDIVHLKDKAGHEYATRMSNVFVIGKEKPFITLPKDKGIRKTVIEERDRRLGLRK